MQKNIKVIHRSFIVFEGKENSKIPMHFVHTALTTFFALHADDEYKL